MHVRYFSRIGVVAAIGLASVAVAFGAPIEAAYTFQYVPMMWATIAAAVFYAVAASVYFGGLSRFAVLQAFATVLRARDDAYRHRVLATAAG